jgi:hypothetical protein
VIASIVGSWASAAAGDDITMGIVRVNGLREKEGETSVE